MKTIQDIRIYRSEIDNTDGNSLPTGFYNKELCVIIRRIVMKLRENEFSLGDFHHLYINFTTCIPRNEIIPANRSVDKYYPWYRYYDIGVNEDFFNSLETTECCTAVLNLLEKLLIKYFSLNSETEELIKSSISQAVAKGENMLMKYKEKKSARNYAVLYLRYSDKGMYFPLLRVYDLNNNLILSADLPETSDYLSFGSIQLSSKRVTINPRKNAASTNLELGSISFDL